MGIRQRLAEDRDARWEAEAKADWADSPLGRARSAQQRGDIFFQIEMDLIGGGQGFSLRDGRSVSASDLLGAIEASGWTLEHAGYVPGNGGLRGVYLFRDAGSARIGNHQR